VASFQACVRTPFATLGITTTDTHVTGIRFLAPSIAAHGAGAELARLPRVRADPGLPREPALRLRPAAALSRHAPPLAVWEAMQRIPAGKTRTYGELARELESSPRAVGGACGANPIPLVVPCHRVIAADARIGGFMGGARKASSSHQALAAGA
jgi:methylated-DNA-[protein]-cysteine S-methyltransferase